MSPFSKVEMSPFLVLKLELQHERCGAGGSLLRMSQRELTRLEVIHGPTLPTEKLTAEGVSLSAETVRQLLIATTRLQNVR
jgi:hypothetical protein